jgi:hypothetical protein
MLSQRELSEEYSSQLDTLRSVIEQQVEKAMMDNPQLKTKQCQIIAMYQAAYGKHPDEETTPHSLAKAEVVLPLILEAMEMSEEEWKGHLAGMTG